MKDIFDTITMDVMDLVDHDLMDEVELDTEDKIIYSSELKDLLQEEIKKELAKLPFGKMLEKLSKVVERKQNELEKTLREDIFNSKESLTQDLSLVKSEAQETKEKNTDRFVELKNDFLSIGVGNQKIYMGGPAALRIQEEDGTNLGYPTSLKFSTGSITVNEDGSYSVAGSSFSIPEVTTDPSSPTAGDMWVLRSGGNAGEMMGVLGLTYSGFIYQLSYQTNVGTTIRTTLN